MNRFVTLLLAAVMLTAPSGCSTFSCLWHKEATTQVALLDEQGAPVTNVTVKGKLGGDYVLVPREYLEAGTTTPAPTTQPTAARKPAATTNTAATTIQDDGKMRISWDGASRIRIRCIQKFGAVDVYPGRGGERYVGKKDQPPVVTIDGYIDPEVVGPIIEKVRRQNQAALAANPRLPQKDLTMVCFNFHSPTGERYAEHLTDDGNWAMVAPASANPGGRVVLSGGVGIAGEIAETADTDHKAGARIHCFAVIPQ